MLKINPKYFIHIDATDIQRIGWQEFIQNYYSYEFYLKHKDRVEEETANFLSSILLGNNIITTRESVDIIKINPYIFDELYNKLVNKLEELSEINISHTNFSYATSFSNVNTHNFMWVITCCARKWREYMNLQALSSITYNRSKNTSTYLSFLNEIKDELRSILGLPKHENVANYFSFKFQQ